MVAQVRAAIDAPNSFFKGAIQMDNKQIRDDKITAQEILKDAELDSVTGGIAIPTLHGGTGSGGRANVNMEIYTDDPSKITDYAGSTGPG